MTDDYEHVVHLEVIDIQLHSSDDPVEVVEEAIEWFEELNEQQKVDVFIALLGRMN